MVKALGIHAFAALAFCQCPLLVRVQLCAASGSCHPSPSSCSSNAVSWLQSPADGFSMSFSDHWQLRVPNIGLAGCMYQSHWLVTVPLPLSAHASSNLKEACTPINGIKPPRAVAGFCICFTLLAVAFITVASISVCWDDNPTLSGGRNLDDDWHLSPMRM